MRSEGIAGATTRAIAAHAGIAEGSIYRHFRDKADVVQSAIRQHFLPSHVRFLVDLKNKAGTATPARHLRDLLHHMLAFYREVMPLMTSLLAETDFRDRFQEQLKEQNAGPHRANELVANYIEAESKVGRLPKRVRPQAAAAMLLGACFQRVFFEQTVGADRLQLSDDQLVNQTVQIICAE